MTKIRIQPNAHAGWALPVSIKKKWMKLLRSGEYKQGTSMLYNEDSKKYCCLGLLGKACGLKESVMNEIDLPETVSKTMFGVANDFNWEVPIIDNDNGNIDIPLYGLNDEDRLSFKRIADIIEKTVPTYKG